MSQKQTILKQKDFASNTWLNWHEDTDVLAFNWGNLKVEKKQRQYELFVWRKGKVRKISWKNNDWSMKSHNKVQWSKNAKQLYLGLFPEEKKGQWVENQSADDKKQEKTLTEILSSESLVKDRGLTIWHGNDPYIKPHEKKAL